MNQEKNVILLIAGIASIIAALAHIVVILGGPDWYRAFGAGEEMAIMAQNGSIYPALLTLLIAAILAVWGLYAFSGGKYIFRLPLLKFCLLAITSVYCVRGIYGFFLPFVSNNVHVQSMGLHFWFLSSSICLFIGLLHMVGIKKSWQHLGKNHT